MANVASAPNDVAPRRGGRVTTRTAVVAAGVAGLFVFAVPRVAGAPWALIWRQLVVVTPWQLSLLTAVWAGGLLLHTITLTSALPGLTRRRALTLSLTGSAVANVLPFGGAAGVALNYRMVRAWGHDRPAFAAYTVVTNVWDVLVKLALPLAAVPLLYLTGPDVLGRYAGPGLAAALVGLLLLAAVCRTALSPTATARAGDAIDTAGLALLRALRVRRRPRVGTALVRLRSDCSQVVRSRWRGLTTGMLAYTATLAVLLWACLHVSGAGLPVRAVLVGFAAERLLTVAGVTPGGAGLVELGLAGLLVALGGAPLAVVSGVLLYRLFTFGIEIPVGGVGLAAWLWVHRGERRGRAP